MRAYHLPDVCSTNMAIIFSTDPRIALWINTGRFTSPLAFVYCKESLN